ncbi:MAG: glycosyltransferase [Bacteroidales bacterium]|nr:glycosyltransferase [Bacteroidales bacterium]
MSKLRVVSICTSDTYGGAARAAYRIHQAVNARGEVESVMFVKDKRTNDSTVHSLTEYLPKGMWFRGFDWCANKVKNKLQHARWRRYRDTQDVSYKSDLRGTRFYKALKELHPDVIHLHWINLRFIYLPELVRYIKKQARQGKHIPIVWTQHDSWAFCGVCHYFLDCDGYKQQCGNCPQLMPDKARQSNNDLSHQLWIQKQRCYADLDFHVVAPSRWLADCAKESSLFHHVDVRVIPNNIDTNMFSPSDDVSKTTNLFAKPYVLYGAVNAATDKRKGFAYLLEALKIIEQQYAAQHSEVPFELVVFGANEGDLPMSLNIPIHYMGFVSDTQQLVSLYRNASVMVVPSLTENLSCAIMESLSCGTPVVAFNIGGNSDMITHQQNGFLAKEKDNADLAQGILWTFEHNAHNELRNTARTSVLERFTGDIVAQQYIALYQQSIRK